MDKKIIKELILHNMPHYPVSKKELAGKYGSGVTGALSDLVDEGYLVRVKRGVYSLSDELLDEAGLSDRQTINKPLMTIESLHILLGAFISQYSVSTLLSKGLGDVLLEVDYYTTTHTGMEDERLEESLYGLNEYLNRYQLTSEGEKVVALLFGV